mmetsp:Transcript_11764/g.33295  ORF Transcript_11764/g.33295 Transcript_11764/m.33295 type:complete len:217 (-) Transcript_11764:1109-1759(-)
MAKLTGRDEAVLVDVNEAECAFDLDVAEGGIQLNGSFHGRWLFLDDLVCHAVHSLGVVKGVHVWLKQRVGHAAVRHKLEPDMNLTRLIDSSPVVLVANDDPSVDDAFAEERQKRERRLANEVVGAEGILVEHLHHDFMVIDQVKYTVFVPMRLSPAVLVRANARLVVCNVVVGLDLVLDVRVLLAERVFVNQVAAFNGGDGQLASRVELNGERYLA